MGSFTASAKAAAAIQSACAKRLVEFALPHVIRGMIALLIMNNYVKFEYSSNIYLIIGCQMFIV